MKTSVKLLLGGAVVLLVLTGAMITRLGVYFFYQQSDYVHFTRYDDALIRRVPPLAKFNAVEVEGFWKVKLTKGASHQVVIKAPREVQERMTTRVEDGVLRLNQNVFSLGSSHHPELEITLPSLRRLKIRGGNEVAFAGFQDAQTVLDVRGLNDVKGRACHMDQLRLSGVGGIGVDLSACHIKNAELDLSGLGEIKLNMAGGELKGKVGTEISVEHTGTLKRKSLTVVSSAGTR